MIGLKIKKAASKRDGLVDGRVGGEGEEAGLRRHQVGHDADSGLRGAGDEDPLVLLGIDGEGEAQGQRLEEE